jgi:hypothetical protein
MRLIRLISSAAITLIILLFADQSYAQENLATARPTSAIGAWTLPSNSFQFEQGFTFVNDTLELDGLYRLSFSKIAELRFKTSYGSNNVEFGVKVMLLDPDRHKTGLALKISVDKDFIVRDFRMVVTQTLTDRFSVFGNFGVRPGGRWYGIGLLNIGLGDKFSTYLEGDFRDGFQQYNTGLTYLIGSETQLDISTGLISNGSEFYGFEDSVYFGVGFSQRLKFDKLIH